ncbi:MAG TPA: sulfocyanin-like copper-binding protein [Candidatus Nanopelagicaceae bacterium]|nr:sulfocyanin-like copper-binding protein [Candidatus Nanopelagicaceae bacterium]
MMNSGYGYGQAGASWLVMALMVLAFWSAVVGLLIYLLHRGQARPDRVRPVSNEAEQILAERLARGEIGKEEFTNRRKALRVGRGKWLNRRTSIVIGVTTALVLSGFSLGAFGGGSNHSRFGFPARSTCTSPNLSGAVVNVALIDMGGMMFSGPMRLSTDQTTVSSGTVSFLATNYGSRTHELVILPLSNSQIAGDRPVGGDGKIDEAGSLGEASNTCGDGAGEGIAPGASSWVTVTLAPGRYEVLCNLRGHYAAGMYSELTVS